VELCLPYLGKAVPPQPTWPAMPFHHYSLHIPVVVAMAGGCDKWWSYMGVMAIWIGSWWLERCLW